MRALYVFAELPAVRESRFDTGNIIERKVRVYDGFFICPFALLIGPFVYKMRRSGVRVVLLSLVLVTANMFAQIWPAQPHYAAPVLGALILALLYSVGQPLRSTVVKPMSSGLTEIAAPRSQ
jgi:hypothetical protein